MLIISTILPPTKVRTRSRPQMVTLFLSPTPVKDFFPYRTRLDSRDHRPLLHGQLHNGLYHIRTASSPTPTALTASSSTSRHWHTRSNSGYFLSQEHYATKLLNDAGYKDCKAAPTPIAPKSKQPVHISPPFADPSLYRRLAGSLQYLSITRPDIAFATNRVCQHIQSPTEDFKALKRLLRYIKGTLSYGLPITPGSLELRSYSDADWASDSTDRKSVSGYCTFLGPNLISWTMKKQATVAKSSTEAVYRSLSAAASDVVWLRRLAFELQLPQHQPTTIHCDNTSAMAIAKNPVFHARTKHIEIDYHFIRQQIGAGVIQLEYIPSQEQVADILTKPFSITRFLELRSKLTIRTPTA
ncbi:hypothetical protein KFK09_018473 [Dendrobium nobile]|uniref:Mitochondrial protein n=1 Tax=Dendrobium nobile TaxID=94219 RepID=A0A8T3AUX2_DENNO|nr:hypothetical protein KFK09_018473 [Dendrobium nobile]